MILSNRDDTMISKGVCTMGSRAYDRGHTRRIGLKLNTKYDADIIAKLESVTSMQGYIKSLIRADISCSDWKENANQIVCSSCGASYKDEILYLAELNHCPSCGSPMNTIKRSETADEEYNSLLQTVREIGGVQ